jgi:Omp85 superfamily domain
MPVFLLCLLLSAAALLSAGQSFLQQASETNVNQRYFIESVSLGGVDLDQVASPRLPSTLRYRLKAMVGRQCDPEALQQLSSEIRRELHFRTVTEHLLKGSAPDQVRVDFDVVRGDLTFDVSLPRLLYTSQKGFTGEADASIGFHQNSLTLGAVSNGDDLIERFTGFAIRFDSAPLGTDKLRAHLIFEDYHEQWNPMTRAAAGAESLDLYRSRWNVAPQLTFLVAVPVSVSLGASFEQTDSETAAIGNRSTNAATLDVRYGRKMEGGTIQQRIEGKYSLRVATRALGSTYAYARHMISFKYEAKSGRHIATDEFMAGAIAGQAPFFDRFVLGSSSTLRGWDRYSLDPLGGTRVVHNEVTYGYRVGEGTVEAFYDTGAVWQPDRQTTLRHSVGVGYKQGIFVLATGFPLRNGRVEPMFMAGMNY